MPHPIYTPIGPTAGLAGSFQAISQNTSNAGVGRPIGEQPIAGSNGTGDAQGGGSNGGFSGGCSGEQNTGTPSTAYPGTSNNMVNINNCYQPAAEHSLAGSPYQVCKGGCPPHGAGQ